MDMKQDIAQSPIDWSMLLVAWIVENFQIKKKKAKP
jgi:hypothetical protein